MAGAWLEHQQPAMATAVIVERCPRCDRSDDRLVAGDGRGIRRRMLLFPPQTLNAFFYSTRRELFVVIRWE